MIKVYMWNPKLPNVGHLSMQLSDGTYISFWPDEELVLLRKKTGGSQSYEDDVESEEREADEVLKLPADIVDQDKIRSWWKDFAKENKYHLFGNNCAAVVKHALEVVGGIYQTTYLSEGGYYSFGMIKTPEEVFYWATECGKLYPRRSDESIAEKAFNSVVNFFRS